MRIRTKVCEKAHYPLSGHPANNPEARRGEATELREAEAFPKRFA